MSVIPWGNEGWLNHISSYIHFCLGKLKKLLDVLQFRKCQELVYICHTCSFNIANIYKGRDLS